MADPTAQQTTPLFGVPLTPAPQAPPVAAPAAPAAPQRYQEQDGKHRGVAGVARDILGTLGDFLLTRLHMPAMYAPAQRDRKLAAAQANIDTDPIGSIQQVSSIDPVFGAKLRDQYIDNQRLAATQASTEEARNARLAQAQEVQNMRTRGYAAAMLSSIANWDDAKRQQFYPQMRQQVIAAGNKQGLDLSSELPETYDSIMLDAFIDGAVPVGTQRAQRLTRERMEQQGEQFQQRDATTRRGQDISSTDRRRGQDVTARGQTIRSTDTRHGQNIRSTDRRAGQAETRRHNRAMEARPGRFTPDPNRIYTQNGRQFRYNPRTRTYDLLN